MRILAIESSTRYATAGVYQCTCELSANRSEILSSLFDPATSDSDIAPNFTQLGTFSNRESFPPVNSNNSSADLFPGIQQLLTQSNTEIQEVDLFAVALGPGSFTGLRLGVVLAKTFGFSTNGKVKGVNLFDVLAYQAMPWLNSRELSQVSVGLNIGRGDVLVSLYQLQKNEMTCLQPASIQKPSDWIDGLDETTAVSGSAVDLMKNQQPHSSRAIPAELRSATNEAVAKLAAVNFAADGPDDVWSLSPIYSRPSAAEEAAKSKTLDSHQMSSDPTP